MKKRDILAAVSVAVFCLSGAILVTILLSKLLFVWRMQYINTQSIVGISTEKVIMNYDMLIRYLINPWDTVLSLPDFPMSKAASFHFYEVKQLFLINNLLFVVSLFSSIWAYRYIKTMCRWNIFEKLGRYLVIVPIVLSVILTIGFDFWFVIFHKMLFNNNDWLFNPITDPIILVLPESFFLSCFIMVIIIFECAVLLFWLHCKRKNKGI